MYNSNIIGMGMYVPENVVTNNDLSTMMDTSNEWIVERTGIEERRHIKKGDGNTTATMGAKAAKIAIERADINKNDIDLILFATLSPDYYFPGSGVIVQQLLEIRT
jgi:3-oxoacyl-[acyl-carrier-protein] synthase-3